MATGVAVQGVLTLDAVRPELVDTDVIRPAPDGYNDLLGEGDPLQAELRAVAYPYLWLPRLRGVYVYSFFNDYYNRIHVFPSPLDFGYVASETSQSFQVWNAFLEPHHLDSLLPTNDLGLTLSGGPTTDYWFLGLEAITYTVTASVNGPGTVDANYTFTFAGLPIAEISIKGQRVILFPFEPNWINPVLERLEWLTSVTEMRNGAEERARMRQNPRQTLEYNFLLHHDHQRLLQSLFFGWQGRAWGVPLWFQGQYAATALTAGSTRINCDTVGYEFQVGGSVVLYASPTRYETLTIASVDETGITTSSALMSNWPVRSWIYPLRVGMIQGEPTLKYITGEVLEGGVQFKSQNHLLGLGDWIATYRGRPVLEIEPQRRDSIDETWQRRTNTLDYSVGQTMTFDKDPFSKAVRKGDYWSLHKSNLTQFRPVLNFAQGRWKSFWAPTFDNDMKIVEDVLDNDSTLVIKDICYTKYVNFHPLRNHLRLQLKNGTIHYREIIGADDINTPPGTETLTMDTPFTAGFAISDVRLLSFMPLCRLESDTVELGYTTMHVASSSLSLRPTLDEQTL